MSKLRNLRKFQEKNLFNFLKVLMRRKQILYNCYISDNILKNKRRLLLAVEGGRGSSEPTRSIKSGDHLQIRV